MARKGGKRLQAKRKASTTKRRPIVQRISIPLRPSYVKYKTIPIVKDARRVFPRSLRRAFVLDDE